MNNWEFLEVVLLNLSSYFMCLTFSLVLYIIVFRLFYKFLIDPLVLNVIASAIGFSVVLFLYVQSKISNWYFYSYILSQIAFFLGFVVVKSKHVRQSRYVKIENEPIFIKVLFFNTSIIYVLAQLLLYKTKGIPILLESRLELFVDSNGAGILARILYVSGIVTLYLLFYFLLVNRQRGFSKWYVYSILLFVFISYILSGSKSSFLLIFFSFFTFVVTNPQLFRLLNVSKFIKYDKLIILISIIIVVFLYAINNDGSLIGGCISFLSRLLGYGDVYWYAYPYGYIESLESSSPFLALFQDLLGLTRIYNWEELPQVLGIDLYLMHHNTDVLQGPNSRHNVFGYVYFGFYGGILFSFILGFVLGAVRRCFFNSCNHSLIYKIALSILYLSIVTLETDVQLTLQNINSFIIVYPVLILFAFILYKSYYPIARNV